MAQARLIQANQPIQAQRQPGVPAAYFGTDIAEATAEMGSVFERIQDGADTAEATRKLAQTHAAYVETLANDARTIQNPEEYNATAKAHLEDLQKGAVESASNNRVKSLIRNRLVVIHADATTKSKGIYYEKKKDNAQADFIAAKELLVNNLAQAGSQNNRNEMAAMFGNMVGGMKANGYLTPQEAAKQLEDFDGETQKARASYMLQTNPEGLQMALKAGEFPKLDAYNWDQKANEVLREQRNRIKEFEAERLKVVNNDLLIQMERTPVSGLTAFRENVLDRQDLDADTKRFWIDRTSQRIANIQRQAEHQESIAFTRENRAATRANRAYTEEQRAYLQQKRREEIADRPYTHSDGATLGRVMSGILAQPDKWDQGQVLDLMGKGLSVGDTMRANSLLQDVTKLPKEGQPLQNAIKTLEQMQKDMVFLPTDKRTAFTDQDRSDNDARMQSVMSQLIQRSKQPNADPQAILNELMQPYYEQEITGWWSTLQKFDPFTTEASRYTRDERIKARQMLAAGNQEMTEENIIKAAKHLRDKAKPK
jgi:hypothetical protein